MPALRSLTLDDLDPNWRASGRWRLGAAPGEAGGMSLPVATVHIHHSVTADTGDVIRDGADVCDIDQARFGKVSYSWMAHESTYSFIEAEGVHRGAHTINNAQQSLNGISFGIAAIGNFEPTANVPPPRPASDRLVSLIAEGIVEQLVKPGGLVRVNFVIDGHRDVFATACCGQSLYDRLADIRNLVAHPAPGPEVEMPAPSVVVHDGHEKVYTRGIDGALWEKIDAAGAWHSLGGSLDHGPSACVDSLGILHLFVCGVDGQLWHRYQINGHWSGWEPLGGILTSGPEASATVWNGQRRIDIAVRGQDAGTYVLSFYGEAWRGWANLGGLS